MATVEQRRVGLGAVARPHAAGVGRGAVGLLFIAPAGLMTIAFFLVPLAMALWISLHSWPVLGAKTFVGLRNYASLTGDPVFWQAFLFTVKYTLLVTPLIFVPALLLALLVNERLRGVSIFRTAYFIPYVISMATAALMWKWIYNEVFGLLNYLLLTLGLIGAPIIWLGDATTALLSIVIAIVWKVAGLNMVLLLAGLQVIPTDLYEAAAVDGASAWQRFVRITLPLLRPTFAMALTISVIGSFLAFDQFFVMTGGGPGHDTTPIVMWIYRTSFQFFQMGTGAAMSFVLMAILLTLSYLQMRVLHRATEY
jgi:multiple sugar transport system permease protein